MDETQMQSVGAVVKTLREAAGLTRRDLVELTAAVPGERVSVEMLAKVEQGKKAPSAKTLRKLAAALGVEPMDLTSRAVWWEVGVMAEINPAHLRQGVLQGRGVTAASAAAAVTGAASVAFPIMSAAIAAAARQREEREQIAAKLQQRLTELLQEGSDAEVARLVRLLGSEGDDSGEAGGAAT